MGLWLPAFGVSCWLVCAGGIVWCVMYVSYGLAKWVGLVGYVVVWVLWAGCGVVDLFCLIVLVTFIEL